MKGWKGKMRGKKLKQIWYWFIIVTLLFGNFYPVTKVNAASDGVTLDGDTVTVAKGSDLMVVQVCAPQIIKVNYKPNGVQDPETLVIDPNKKWSTGNIISSDLSSDPAIIKTAKSTIKISKSNFGVSVYDVSNSLVLQQTSLDSNSVSFSHASGQNFYGIGGDGANDSSSGPLKTGSNSVYAGGQGHCGAPFTWSNGGYGLLVDSDGGNINIGDTSLKYSGISKKNTEYFVMIGTPTELLSAEAQISGTSPMFPKWATGFTNTQWGWRDSTKTDEDQLKDTINKYRSGGYPIDNFCLDFDWKNWGEGNYGEFTWNNKNFPGGSSGELKQSMAAQGVKLTGIAKPRLFVGTQEDTALTAINGWMPNSSAYEDYCAKQFQTTLRNVRNVDYSKDAVRNWWWSQEKGSFDSGIVGFWNDECDSPNNFANFDNLNMQRANYEGQTAYTTNQRAWSINRTYYAGAQRYAYGLWSGDIGSGFPSMKAQKDKMIEAVNLGEAKWGMDTGGFNGTPNSENYARWLEFSAFTPIFRVHGQHVPDTSTERYPWNFGDTAAAAAKNVMHLRYQLIPYIYKYDQQASDSGIGLVKSLMMEYPNDTNAKNDTDAWIFGDYMLVSPVLDQGQTSKSIYLPAGTWTDYFTGKTYTGGQTINYTIDSTTWKDVPLFIKQGAIIPSQDYENYVGEKKMTNIYVDVFPDVQKTSFDYYDDDGNTTSYKSGNYFKQKLTVQRSDDWKSVEFNTLLKEGSYTPDVQNYIVKLHVTSTGAVTVGGQTLSKYSSLDQLKSVSGEGYATGTDVYGDVVYVKVAAGQLKDVVAPCTFNGTVKNTTLYERSSASTLSMQYSLDSGNTWSASQAMSKSNITGYFQNSFSYTMTNSYPVKVRFSDGNTNLPSDAGVVLPSTGDTFTIAKDGTVTSGIPKTNTTNIYIGTTTGNQPKLQYKDDTGNWSNDILMPAYGADSGHYMSSLSFPTDVTPVVRYSDDSGVTWKPSTQGQSVNQGDYYNDNTGTLIQGNPGWSNAVTIYYKKGYNTPYIHWRASGGTWTTVPGNKMQDAEVTGYAKATLNIGTATSAEVCFNDGNGHWDNNGGKNYIFNAGYSTFSAGTITSGTPLGPVQLIVSPSVKGGTYTSVQTVALTSSVKTASIYYTIDGTTPTSGSIKYTAPLTINSTTTLKAIAVDTTGNQSTIDTEQYTINIPVVTITASANIKGGTYTSAQTISLTASVSNAAIYYTTDGSTPTILSTKYSLQIVVNSSEMLKFIAVDNLNNQSQVYTEQYVINIAPPVYTITIDTNVNDVANSKAKNITLTPSSAATIYYTEDGTTPTVLSTKYIGTFQTNSGTILKYYAQDTSGNKSQIYTLNINVQQITVHFKKPSSWLAPNMYYYDASGQLTGPAAPGVSMTAEGDDWYTYTIQGWTYATVSFNDGTNQSPASGQAGYDVSGEKWILDGKIYSSKPSSTSASAMISNTNLVSLLAA